MSGKDVAGLAGWESLLCCRALNLSFNRWHSRRGSCGSRRRGVARLLVAVELLGSCWLIGLIIIHRFTFRFPAKNLLRFRLNFPKLLKIPELKQRDHAGVPAA